MEKFERLERKLVARGTVIDYYHDIVKIPNGNIVTWDFIKHKGAAAVVAVREDGVIDDFQVGRKFCRTVGIDHFGVG